MIRGDQRFKGSYSVWQVQHFVSFRSLEMTGSRPLYNIKSSKDVSKKRCSDYVTNRRAVLERQHLLRNVLPPPSNIELLNEVSV